MTRWELSPRERLLLNAALNPDAAVAVASWQHWASQVPLEEAPPPELRLLPAAYAHLYRVAPTLELPKKLRGNVRATFCRTTLLADGSLPIIEQLSRHSPVMLTKGLAMCLRFNAWASRPMWDVDIHVPFEALDKVCQVFAEFNWTPRYGMTGESLVRRSCLRRNSWNFTKGLVDVDLHWRLRGSRTEPWLERQMWESCEEVEYSGRTLLIQSAEFAVISSLNHGFLEGNRSDLLQTVLDSAWLLPVCKSDDLLRLLHKSELLEPFRVLTNILDGVEMSDWASTMARLIDKANEARVKSAPARGSFKPATESALLRQPFLYWLWNLFGRKARLERLLLKWTGPLSKPLKPAHAKEEYDMRECAVIDEIGGPGWCWPEPDRTCFWADRADARLLVPLKHIQDHLLVLAFADHQRRSPNGRIDVFANGLYVTEIDLSKSVSATACCVTITRRMLFGPWVELSFRPKPYVGGVAKHDRGLSVALRKLRILDLGRINEMFSGHNPPQLHMRLLRGEEPYASKFARIQAKIESSPHKGASELPEDFDPLVYVLSYGDLFEAEVDPYKHFIDYGRHENRAWR